MIRFFGKQENSELDSTEIRLRSVERKINFVLVIVSSQLLLSVALLVKETFVPSPITIGLIAVLLIGGVWLFRKPLLSLVKRKVLQSMFDAESSPQKHPANSGNDNAVR